MGLVGLILTAIFPIVAHAGEDDIDWTDIRVKTAYTCEIKLFQKTGMPYYKFSSIKHKVYLPTKYASVYVDSMIINFMEIQNGIRRCASLISVKVHTQLNYVMVFSIVGSNKIKEFKIFKTYRKTNMMPFIACETNTGAKIERLFGQKEVFSINEVNMADKKKSTEAAICSIHRKKTKYIHQKIKPTSYRIY